MKTEICTPRKFPTIQYDVQDKATFSFSLSYIYTWLCHREGFLTLGVQNASLVIHIAELIDGCGREMWSAVNGWIKQ